MGNLDEVENFFEDVDKTVDLISKNNIVINKDDDIPPLSEVQREVILKRWHLDPKKPPSIKELIELAYPHCGFDGRSKQGKLVKEFMAGYGIEPKTNAPTEKIGEYTLSNAEEDFIRNNYYCMKTMEMAQNLWGRGITPLDRKSKALIRYTKNLSGLPREDGLDTSFNDVHEIPDGTFEPPKTYTKCLNLVNKYAYNVIDFHNASEKDKRGIETLIRYLHSPRFIFMINSYTENRNRELFLSEIIRSAYDKPDLTNEELNQVFNLATEYVMGATIQEEMEMLNRRLRKLGDDDDAKVSISLCEAINAKTKEFNDCQNRQKGLIKEINGSRSARLKNMADVNQSVLSLVEYWKEKKKRDKAIHVANMRKKLVNNELERLITLDNIKAEVFGAIGNE